ncbi:MAG: biotin--[acetyl-CoA-carboxylase] ligase [Succinivibrio sp.]|nr:biotin--[acetyl-CoA-carboxylase] ligase [Succinivibrio sp.]
MESALSGVFAVLRCLNEEQSLSLSYENLSLQTSLSEEALKRIARTINAIDPVIIINSDYLKLRYPLDLLDQEYIYTEAKGRGRVEIAEVIDSTNSEFLRRVDNLVSGDVLLAEVQTSGRGRRNTDWYSPIGCQLILSLCHSFADLRFSRGLSVATGVTVARFIESLGLRGIQVKWPNDLYLNNLKLGGILIESLRTTSGFMTVIGLGLNIHRPAKHSESISWLDKASDLNFSRSRVAAGLIGALRSMCAEFSQCGLSPFLADFARYDRLRGHEIIIENETGSFRGIVDGVDSSGRLRLLKDGICRFLSTGHITTYKSRGCENARF